jgi:hypothetical protein
MGYNWCFKNVEGQAWWLTSVIPATPEAEVRRIMIQDKPREKVSEAPSYQ